jgi:hypothetical protein
MPGNRDVQAVVELERAAAPILGGCSRHGTGCATRAADVELVSLQRAGAATRSP